MFGPPARLAMMTGNRSWTDTTAEESTGKSNANINYELRPSSPPPSLSLAVGRHKKDDVIEVITKDLVRNLK